MPLEIFTKALADLTRLRILLLLVGKPELCVCELTQALALAQPKISRHLAILRESGLLLDRKAGLWVYYRLHPELPAWVTQTLTQWQAVNVSSEPYQQDQLRMSQSQRQNPACEVCD